MCVKCNKKQINTTHVRQVAGEIVQISVQINDYIPVVILLQTDIVVIVDDIQTRAWQLLSSWTLLLSENMLKL